jgi:hypothetical protein
MNKEFIPYELALELKQLGFDEPCLGYYRGVLGKPEVELIICQTPPRFYHLMTIPEHFDILAPTYSQAFRFFRENHNLHSYIDILKRYNGKSVYEFVIVSDDIEEEENNRRWKNYEEAEFECLKELIEIVKENTK